MARRTALPFAKDDGGRVEAGFRGDTGDCVTRAIAIAGGAAVQGRLRRAQRTGQSREVGKRERPSNSRTGVFRKVYEPYLFDLGFVWRPTMGIGTGCRVHLAVGRAPGWPGHCSGVWPPECGRQRGGSRQPRPDSWRDTVRVRLLREDRPVISDPFTPPSRASFRAHSGTSRRPLRAPMRSRASHPPRAPSDRRGAGERARGDAPKWLFGFQRGVMVASR